MAYYGKNGQIRYGPRKTVNFKVMRNGGIIYVYKNPRVSSVYIEQNGALSFTEFRPKREDVIGLVGVKVPKKFNNPHALVIEHDLQEGVKQALAEAKEIADRQRK